MDRAIWFEKWAWCYMPCHWKGVGAMVAVIVPTGVAAFLVDAAVHALGIPSADWLDVVPLLVGIYTSMAIAKRHS